MTANIYIVYLRFLVKLNFWYKFLSYLLHYKIHTKRSGIKLSKGPEGKDHKTWTWIPKICFGLLRLLFKGAQLPDVWPFITGGDIWWLINYCWNLHVQLDKNECIVYYDCVFHWKSTMCKCCVCGILCSCIPLNCFMFTSHGKPTFIQIHLIKWWLKMFLSMHAYTFCILKTISVDRNKYRKSTDNLLGVKQNL